MKTEYERAAVTARRAIFSDPQPPRETLRALVKTAHDLAPNDQERRVWQRYARALSDGHRLKIGTVPVTVTSIDGIDADLVRDVEAAFKEDE